MGWFRISPCQWLLITSWSNTTTMERLWSYIVWESHILFHYCFIHLWHCPADQATRGMCTKERKKRSTSTEVSTLMHYMPILWRSSLHPISTLQQGLEINWIAKKCQTSNFIHFQNVWQTLDPGTPNSFNEEEQQKAIISNVPILHSFICPHHVNIHIYGYANIDNLLRISKSVNLNMVGIYFLVSDCDFVVS